MMAANLQVQTGPSTWYAQPRFADCKACGKLTLQTGDQACRDRNDCHGVVINLVDIAETEYSAPACKLAKPD